MVLKYQPNPQIPDKVAEKKMEVMECNKRLYIQMEENEIVGKALAKDGMDEDDIEDGEGSGARGRGLGARHRSGKAG